MSEHDPLARVERAIRRAGWIAIAAFATAAVAGYHALPMVFAFPDGLAERLAFAAQASALVMLCLLVAVGMVSTGRRRSLEDVAGAAAGPPSPRLAVKVAFLQNTLEQAVLAAVAYLAFASLYGGAWLTMIAVAVVFFIVGRVLFLRGYPHGAPGRALGMTLTLVPTGVLLVAAVLAMVFGASAATAAEKVSLQELQRAAAAANSDAVVVLRDGERVAEWHFDKEPQAIEAMSVVKSVVALGIGRLIELGKIESLDQPVHDFFPEWRQGRKRDITLRHVMDHTTGLQNVRNAGEEIYPAPDALQLALTAELSHDPGQHIEYNNKATNLLSGIIERAYGERMDRFFAAEVFGPMGIDEHHWYYDEAGRPHAMAGIRLHARDLAKLGQLVLDRGEWQGRRLVGAAYIDEMLAQAHAEAPRLGLLWWRHIDPATGEAVAYYGDGYLGQYLVVVPATRTVAVRQVRRTDDYDRETDGFREFVDMAVRLR